MSFVESIDTSLYLYLYLYLLVILNFLLSNIKKINGITKCATFVLLVFIISLPAFRGEDSSSDTSNYIDYFLNPRKGYRIENQDIETGYHIFISILRYITNDWKVFITVSSLISTIPIVVTIIKCSKSPAFSTLLFLIAGPVGIIYLFYFGIIRQAMSVGFFYILLCLLYTNVLCIKRKSDLWKITALVVLAYSFHHSTILLVPFLFLINMDLTWKKVICITMLSLWIGTVGIAGFFSLGISSYNKSWYFDLSSLNDAISIISAVPLNLIGLGVFYSIKKKYRNDLWMKLFLYSVWLQNLLLFSVSSNLGRMLFASFLSIIILLPNYWTFMGQKQVMKYVICLFAIVYYSTKYFAILTMYLEFPGWEGLFPYQPYFK